MGIAVSGSLGVGGMGCGGAGRRDLEQGRSRGSSEMSQELVQSRASQPQAGREESR